jgi:hypothetical protein
VRDEVSWEGGLTEPDTYLYKQNKSVLNCIAVAKGEIKSLECAPLFVVAKQRNSMCDVSYG